MSNVLLIKGISQYDAMRYYIEEIEIGFRLAGYNTILLDTYEGSFLFQLDELIKSVKIDLVFTCNGIVYDLLRERMPDVLYVTYLCDHPAAHFERLKTFNKNTIVFTCDALHEKFVQEYYDNIDYAKYIPLAGSCSKKQVPYGERRYDVVFTGTYSKPEDAYNQLLSNLSGSLKPFGEYVLKKIIDIPELTIDQCLKESLEEYGMDVSKDEFLELVYDFIWADIWARNYYRDKMIRCLIENGLDVHVFGNGWEEFESDFKDHLIIEKGNSYLARKAVADAKISLNIMPWFKAGFQERIATAMLSGSVAVSDQSDYICDNFTDGEEIVLFSLRDLSQLPVKICSLLENREVAEKIAMKGKERAENELTWQHRTFDMIAYIKEVYEYNLFPAPSYGNVIKIPYQHKNSQLVAVDVIKAIDSLFEMLEHIQQYDQLELCDIQYFYTQYLYLFMKVKANFPEVDISDYVYNYLMNVDEKDVSNGIDLFVMELSKLQNAFLKAEHNRIRTESDGYQQRLQSLENTPNTYAYKLLIHKLENNYRTSEDPEIQQILENIKKQGYVLPYNQDFIKKHTIAKKNMPKVYYDEEAGMHYVFLDDKRMYYPKGHSEGSVLGQVCFCCLEQDENSPHRYLDETFQVMEGDIVIDAGVAEGNFALCVVEKAKKVYLVECEHEWVEALEKTFEPWREKVVIIEKMLGNQDDDTHIMIDSFVEEGEVNFIKLDVEGAEIDSLKGASKVLDNSKHAKCAICAYHRKYAEKDIRVFLEEKGFYTTTTKGYMFFKEDMDSWTDGELRRGIVRAVKDIIE